MVWILEIFDHPTFLLRGLGKPRERVGGRNGDDQKSEEPVSKQNNQVLSENGGPLKCV